MAAIAQVEPLTTARALRGPFDYRLPDGLRARVEVGSMLIVPFGGRELLGVVVGLADRSEVADDRLVAPVRALELGVPPDLVALSEWIADEYCSTRARALGLVLPPGASAGARPRRALTAVLTDQGRAALTGAARLTDGQRSVLGALRQRGELPATATGADHGALRRLAARGLIELVHREARRRPAHAAVGARALAAPELNQDQLAVLAELDEAIAARRGERVLLHGVTGSGKTEIYLQAAARVLDQGRSAIVLVPEIALTPQIVGRFIDRFGDTVAVLHSRLSVGERLDEWRRLRRGEARVCVGPRSAVFAPLADLGLIVLDEEHDASYKHEGDPRYDARLVAERRSEQVGAVLVAGSATPRPESVHRLRRLRLPHRVDGQALPSIEVLDMRDRAHALHPETSAALADLRRAGGKAIVLLNRRGWSNFLSCRACGHAWSCPSCDVTLVLHRAGGQVCCHHCGHREPLPRRCPECASVSVARHGVGTERLEAELDAALGTSDFEVFRLDADVAATAGRGAAQLRRFERAGSGVLVGTQMVAKGHDFPDVGLAVVVDADSTLRFPDFRAEERTFALVSQLAGRAGRGRAGRDGARGRVLVQTLAPEASSIRLAARHDADGFLTAELARREALGYPPFADLIRVVCSSSRAGAAPVAAAAVAERISAPGATLLGPAPLFRLRGRERSQIVIKASQRPEAVAAVGRAVQATAAQRDHRGVSFSVDVDPQ
ncbi:MAG TPA: primosomal protein N' [Solirubrobacteraceae bacterium]|jgi:primosomal protein N' (replication factor Y)|nr:primosomal protein N' [Solirubrobacteraceae bacterium]